MGLEVSAISIMESEESYVNILLGDYQEPEVSPRRTESVSVRELQTNHRRSFANHGESPTRAFSWLKVPTSAFTFKTIC